MNINDQKPDTCILCKEAGKDGEMYYVRNGVKSSITELLQKIPGHLYHLFKYLPTQTTAWPLCVSTPFCCRTCKKLIEKRQKIVENLAIVENDMIERGRFKPKSCAKSIDFSTVTINDANGEPNCEAKDQIDSGPSAVSPIITPPAKRLHCSLSPIAVHANSCTTGTSNHFAASQPDGDTQTHGKHISNMVQVKVIMLIILGGWPHKLIVLHTLNLNEYESYRK